MSSATKLPPAEAIVLASLIATTPGGIASRILGKASGGNVTLFSFDVAQSLTEHTTPFDALVLVLDGEMMLTIGGQPVLASPGTVVVMPSGVPHAVEARKASKMLLIMLRDVPSA